MTMIVNDWHLLHAHDIAFLLFLVKKSSHINFSYIPPFLYFYYRSNFLNILVIFILI